MPAVTVVRDRYVKGWPRHPDGERAYVLEFGAALDREYSTDAHFAAYRSPNGRRLTREALDQGIEVELTTVVFDVDCAEVHGSSEPAPESWRRAVRQKVCELDAVHPNPFWYETRGGGRIVYAQAEPAIVRTQGDAQQWSQDYAIALAYLARRFGIAADPACHDWQRLYRLPHATRERGGRFENWPSYHDTSQIGALLIEATHEDVSRAKRACRAFDQPKVTARFAPCQSDGYGVLFYALRARGDIVRQHGSDAFVIRCPRERAHSSGRSGDGSTLLYVPKVGEELGCIYCLHAHCANISTREWLAEFTRSELEAARLRAGIRRAA
jgi:hypothetical protein